MKIFTSADHRAFEYKAELIKWLQSEGHEVVDCGNIVYDPVDDYCDFAFKAAKAVVAENQNTNGTTEERAIGIVMCGSGIGVTMAANRIKGARCALSFTPEHAQHGRENDHTNMLALATDSITHEQAHDIINMFLASKPKLDEKYFRRAKKLDEES